MPSAPSARRQRSRQQLLEIIRSHPGGVTRSYLSALTGLSRSAVAEGVLDAYVVVGGSTLYGWDYLAGLLICREAGAADGERDGLDLVVRDASSRRPIVAATPALKERLAAEGTL